MALVSRSRATSDVKSSVAATGGSAAGAELGAAGAGGVAGAEVTAAGGLDAAAGGATAAGAAGVFGRVAGGGLLTAAGGFGAGAAAGADGDAGAIGGDAADGTGADCGGCGDGAGRAGAEVCALFAGAGATARGGSAAALDASVDGDLMAAQPPTARQHSAITHHDACKRPIIELPAKASESISARIASCGEYHERTVSMRP